MTDPSAALPRRAVLAGGLILPLAPRLAWAAPRDLTFAVFRNGSHIGEHHVAFAGGEAALTATTDAAMTVKFGPVPIFRYRHHAVETRKDGVFASMQTATTTNGKVEHVVAERMGPTVHVRRPSGDATFSGDTNPLNHWDQQIFAGPVFNPETGKVMKVQMTKVGDGHWRIRGEADIDDYYDRGGAWRALTGKLDDGSKVEYRRV